MDMRNYNQVQFVTQSFSRRQNTRPWQSLYDWRISLFATRTWNTKL